MAYKYVPRYEKDFTSWFRSNIINPIENIGLYHKIADDSKGLSAQKPFDSIFLYKGVMGAIEFKLLPPYKEESRVHPTSILAPHQNTNLGLMYQKNISLIIVNEYNIWKDDISGAITGTDNVWVYTYLQLLKKEKPLIVLKKEKRDLTLKFIELLESEIKRLNKG
jgi:hypothetical protein